MIELTRRSALAGAAMTTMAAAGGLAPEWARAAAAPAAAQAPGFYRYKVGSIEITVITDGANRLPVTDEFVLNAKKEEVNAALAEAFMEPGVFVGPYNPIVINTGAKLALVDTGTGEAAYKASKGQTGQFLANLAAAGIDANAIDTVIISHYHLVPAAEHAYWTNESEMSRAATKRIADNFKNVQRVISGEVLKRLRTYEADKEVISGVTAVSTPGHTPGHTSHVVASGNAKVYVQADVTHAPFLFVRHPGWHAFYDHDPVQAEATRRKVYDMLAAERMRVQGFHYPFPAIAHIEKTATGYRELPVAWSPVI